MPRAHSDTNNTPLPRLHEAPTVPATSEGPNSADRRTIDGAANRAPERNPHIPEPHAQPTTQKKRKNMRANINIGTLNMNGLTARGMSFLEKWATVNETLNKYKIAVLAIQETHLNQEVVDQLRTSFGKKMHLEFSQDPIAPRKTAGVAFVINKALIAPREILAHELTPGRALALRINWLESESTTLLNIYAPNNKEEHQDFWKDIEVKRLELRLPKPDFMLGDLNVTEDPIDRAPARADDRSATDAIRDTRLAWNIQDAWRLTYPDEREYTYRANVNGQQIQSRLDRIYIASDLINHTFNWITCPTPVPTDHWMVAVKYAPRDAPEIGKGRWTLPLYLLNNNKLLEAIAAKGITLEKNLNDLKENNISRNDNTPQRLWAAFKDDVQEIAKDILGTTHHKINFHIRRLEKDKKALANDPNTDIDNAIRSNEAFLANELKHLEKIAARNKKDGLSAKLDHHEKKLGGIWSALSKERKPRDLIRRLKIPNTTPPQYERGSERMAELAKNYHNDLQTADLPPNTDDHDERVGLILSEIPRAQTLRNSDASAMNQPLVESQVEKALNLSKNGSATGIDGCPYELWKKLHAKYKSSPNANKPRFNIIRVLTIVLADIQINGVDDDSDFALGWMCPLYKKKDKTEISNYRPITLLNTDYKVLTKALAVQLMDQIRSMIHKDQAGFIPKRSIFDHIKLATAIIEYAEVTEENGAIIALDQEKAYDKIRHDYLWATLDAFNLPETFTKTIKTLYLNASTCVAINGFLSNPFKITRGIRQGDPLSCALFDLAIEPLACMIRKDPNLKGLTIPNSHEPLKAKFFADDTSLYLNKTDSLDYAQMILQDWCHVSGAKFNIDKTEVIPIGTPTHRELVVSTRKVNQADRLPLNDRIKIARDGDAIRFLGAWIGNHTNAAVPWEPVIDKINKNLRKWETARPTLKGRKTIVQSTIGGMTQFLTMAQGMPSNIEAALIKITRRFMWNSDSTPRLGLDILQRPIEEGGLNLLDITARNEAIELMWLKAYLDLSPSRPLWATVTDILIDAAAPPTTNPKARINTFLQTWNPATRGPRAAKMGKNTSKMIKTAKKYNTNLEALRIAPHLRTQLPAWYHAAAVPKPVSGVTAKCLLNNHMATKVADLIRISARIRNPISDVNPPHQPITYCYCAACSRDRANGCRNPNECAKEAHARLELITTKLNPLTPGNLHGNLSLTKRRKKWNESAKAQNGEIIFDPTITCKSELADCFRVFTDPQRISDKPAERITTRNTRLRLHEVRIYTDGACLNNGKANARCGSGVWFGPNHEKNKAIRVPGNLQSNQVGELVAIIAATEATPINQPLVIVTDSRYAIEGLTTHLGIWEDKGWVGIKNATLFKRAAYLLKRRTARTAFQWIKGHTGDEGNEGSDLLAKEGAAKEEEDPIDLTIPIEFDLQGAKLASLTQKDSYKGIRDRKKPRKRKATTRNLQITRAALKDYSGETETDESIWIGLQNTAIRSKVRQHLYKMTHATPKIGLYWRYIPQYEERQICQSCQETETMEHILTECRTPARGKIWQLASSLWPHESPQWPTISLGTILGCGSITPIRGTQHQENENRTRSPTQRGAARLLSILISESAYLIWVIRCERVIQEKTHTTLEIERRWLTAINKRLTNDKLTATKVKRDNAHVHKVKLTWEAVLKKNGELPDRWMQHREVLVGTRVGA